MCASTDRELHVCYLKKSYMCATSNRAICVLAQIESYMCATYISNRTQSVCLTESKTKIVASYMLHVQELWSLLLN